ncbi:MAG TPA: AAA family ATPase [Chloroflexi bacterium]|nr:AAA family ATPase [Chloroflexota bacterium]
MSALTTTPVWSTIRPRLARYLPAETFNRLLALPDDLRQLDDAAQRRAAQQLLKANRALEPLRRTLLQYMPRYLIELAPLPGQARGEILSGSFMHADLKGFTALTELLARQGRARGQEEMNRMLNKLFSSLLDPLIASGGDLLIFAGDAALAYFPAQDDAEDTLQAARAGLRMQRAIKPFSTFENEFGQCSLSMRIGVERGQAYAGVVGDAERMELLVSGSGVHAAMLAEAQAEPGRVFLGESARQAAAGHFTLNGAQVVDDLGDDLGDYEVSPPTRKRGGALLLSKDLPDVLQTLNVSLQHVERLAPFLPEDMLARLVNTKRHRHLESEFRPTAVQYINLLGLEELATARGPELATQVLQRYFLRAEEIVTRHEGVISQVDACAKGFFLLNTYGSPKMHEGTTRYAISAALQLAQMLDQVNREFELDPPLRQRGGITHGLVFNGEIGARYRRESVIAGPAVNRGARLMSQARPGQVIVDSDIWSDARSAFVGEELPAVELKGIDGRVVIVNVRNVRYGAQLQPLERPLLGREIEQDFLTGALNALQNGKGGVLLLIAETGLGKTALATHLAQAAQAKDLPILIGRCQPHGKHVPLFPWLDLLIGWLDPDGGGDAIQQRERLSVELAALGLSRWENRLADLLNLPAEATLGESGASDEADVDPLHILTVLFKKLTARSPFLLILEDIDWLDATSLDLLNELLSQMQNLPLLLLLTGRLQRLEIRDLEINDSNNLQSPISNLQFFDHAQDKSPKLVKLHPLNNEAALGVARHHLGARTLDDDLTRWIYHRSGGNPLYVQELCRALERADAVFLDRHTGWAGWTRESPALPLSLHALLLARLDELPLAYQNVLKRAAVMGTTFDARGLQAICAELLDKETVFTALEEAARASLVTAVDNSTYRFKHPLMQEAIYNTLSFSQRRGWHTQTGDWLARSGQAEQSLSLIAYHYLRGDDDAKAAQYGRRAGDQARNRREYAGALEHYQQVLALPDLPAPERAAILESLADALALRGDYRAAAEAYARSAALGNAAARQKQAIVAGDLDALSLLEPTPELQPWADGGRAWLLAQKGRTEPALKLAQTALNKHNLQDGARAGLTELLKTLQANNSPGDYHIWLKQFAKSVLQTPFSPTALLDLPPLSLSIFRKIMRRRLSLTELADDLQLPPEQVQSALDDLIKKGYVRQLKTGRYRAGFDRKREKREKSSSIDIWSALDS